MKKTAYLVWLMLCLAVLAACGGEQPADPTPETAAPTAAPVESGAETADSPPSTSPTTGGTLRIGWAGSPDTLNPGTAVLTEAYTIFELVYDSMYQLELDGEFTLELAESVDISEDGTVYTYKLRPGLMWHDGEPVTAADVAFSYQLYQAQEDFPFLNVYTAYFETIEATDDQTVVLTLTEPIPNLPSQLIYLYILPEHIWGRMTQKAWPSLRTKRSLAVARLS
ncbi:MAG: hypothetical protein IPL28_16000 [Chloroflexi bacterium]|nr:hypothetical protein [Chloroflexota bacterium]